MKLRIKGPTLRLRLTQSEIDALRQYGVVEERVPFPANATLVYRLRRDAQAREIRASYEGSVLEIRIPEAAAQQWCTSEQVTLAHSQPLAEGALHITLEKDFACLTPRSGEDESDNFPHPEAERGKSC
ncbi:MAG: hypothetical protein JOZ89_03760 [Gammaproteobacteria bacterium]|nr:hypothetical protein [Gammaproteobacteria bacterium]